MDVARSPEYKLQKKRRRMIIGAVVVAALALITWGLSRLEPAAREVDEASVWVESVRRGEFLISVRGPGTLVPEEIRWIAAETDGQVEEKVLDPGAVVEPESVILVLSNPQLEQQVGDAELALKRAEAEFENLGMQLQSQLLDRQADFARVEAEWKAAVLQAEADEKLKAEGLVPDIKAQQSQLTAEQMTVRHDIEAERLDRLSDSNAAQLAAQRAQVDQARAVYDLRRRQLDKLTVRAGIHGVLQEVPLDEGESVTPGTKLARVAQPDKLKAELRISETQAKDIQIGQTAEIDIRTSKIAGHVVRIDPAVQQGTVKVDVHLDVAELPKGARPDLSVDGTIELDRAEETLFVGRPAYGQAFSTVGLFKVGEGGIAERVPVKIGRLSVNFVEILDGLVEGDRVILSDTSQFDEEDRIRLN